MPHCYIYLDELLSAVELGHEDVLPVRDSGEGHVELPGGPDVGVFREAPQQRVLHQLHQVESRVQGPQSVPPALFGHRHQIGTAQLCTQETHQRVHTFRSSRTETLQMHFQNTSD